MDMKNLGRKIKELRIALKMRQEDLAKGIVTRGYISQIEKGDASPSFEILTKLAERLNCSVSSLLAESEETSESSTVSPALLFQAERSLDERLLSDFETIIASLDTQTLEPAYQCKLEFLKARFHWEQGSFEAARQLLETCIHHSFPSEFEIRTQAYNLQGRVLYKLHDMQGCLQSFNIALQLAKQLVVDPLLHIDILLNLGIFHCHIDEVTSSLTYLIDAYQINKTKHIFYKTGDILMTLGVCYMKMGNLTEGQTHFQNALRFFDETGQDNLKAGTLTNLGILHTRADEFSVALNYLEEAIRTYSFIQDHQGLLNAKLEMAEAFVRAEKLEEAKQLCNELLLSDLDLVYKAQLHVVLGKIRSHKHDLTGALDHYFQAKAIYQQRESKSKLKQLYLAIGEAYYKHKDFESASHYYRMGI